MSGMRDESAIFREKPGAPATEIEKRAHRALNCLPQLRCLAAKRTLMDTPRPKFRVRARTVGDDARPSAGSP